jgi:outer membrane immunogenic protein
MQHWRLENAACRGKLTSDGSLFSGPYHYDANGMLGGVHIGYDMQSGALVFGAEADIEYAGIDGSWDWQNSDRLSKDIEWTSSIRGRVGYALDRLLIYGTAGVAFAAVDMGVIDGGNLVLSESETTVGWTAGFGAEYALTDRVSVRKEYRYADYGDTSISGSVYNGEFTYPHDNKVHAVRIGASLKF